MKRKTKRWSMEQERAAPSCVCVFVCVCVISALVGVHTRTQTKTHTTPFQTFHAQHANLCPSLSYFTTFAAHKLS